MSVARNWLHVTSFMRHSSALAELYLHLWAFPSSEFGKKYLVQNLVFQSTVWRWSHAWKQIERGPTCLVLLAIFELHIMSAMLCITGTYIVSSNIVQVSIFHFSSYDSFHPIGGATIKLFFTLCNVAVFSYAAIWRRRELLREELLLTLMLLGF